MSELTYEKKNIFKESTPQQLEEIEKFASAYKNYLDSSKTERDAVKTTIAIAEKYGYTPFHFGDKLNVGDKKYYNNRNKNIFLFRIGEEDIEKFGVRISAAHIDSPRIDLKQNPLYEQSGAAYFKTHYYGGVRKYQWATVPLAIHGVVTLTDGKVIDIIIGEQDDEPIFYISDLLPHLSASQNERKLAEGIKGEELNVWAGGMPAASNGNEGDEKDKEKDPVKANVLKMLNAKYGIVEEDLLSAELTCVPALKARDVGFDGAFIAGYGHDDKVCSYPALMAQVENESCHTTMTILADKEEIGSEGTTGMQSMLFTDILEEICLSLNKNIRAVRAASGCLSADVTAAYDPTFADAYEKSNSAIASYGVALMKFTGARGKGSSSDAGSEFMAKVRGILNAEGVIWQTAELGKVDQGGGGTVAKYIASKNIDTLDIGTAVISMHAPYELISKGDLYHTYLAFRAFIK